MRRFLLLAIVITLKNVPIFECSSRGGDWRLVSMSHNSTRVKSAVVSSQSRKLEFPRYNAVKSQLLQSVPEPKIIEAFEMPENFIRCDVVADVAFGGVQLSKLLSHNQCMDSCNASCGQAYGFLFDEKLRPLRHEVHPEGYVLWKKPPPRRPHMRCYHSVMQANYHVKIKKHSTDSDDYRWTPNFCSCGLNFPDNPERGKMFGECDHQLTIQSLRTKFNPAYLRDTSVGKCFLHCYRWEAYVVMKDGERVGIPWCDDGSLARYTPHRQLEGWCSPTNKCFCGSYENLESLQTHKREKIKPETIMLPVDVQTTSLYGGSEANSPTKDARVHRWPRLVKSLQIHYQHEEKESAEEKWERERKELENKKRRALEEYHGTQQRVSEARRMENGTRTMMTIIGQEASSKGRELLAEMDFFVSKEKQRDKLSCLGFATRPSTSWKPFKRNRYSTISERLLMDVTDDCAN